VKRVGLPPAKQAREIGRGPPEQKPPSQFTHWPEHSTFFSTLRPQLHVKALHPSKHGPGYNPTATTSSSRTPRYRILNHLLRHLITVAVASHLPSLPQPPPFPPPDEIVLLNTISAGCGPSRKRFLRTFRETQSHCRAHGVSSPAPVNTANTKAKLLTAIATRRGVKRICTPTTTRKYLFQAKNTSHCSTLSQDCGIHLEH
jgi:hypothetical protein